MLPGRNIEDAAFTGLVERLTMIGLVCEVATESFESLSKEDLLLMLDQIRSCAVQGLAFTGATIDEAKATRRDLLAGMSTASKPQT